MTVAVCPVRPDSRGTIMARSPDSTVAPVITPNYLSDLNDARVLIAGMRFTRAIFASPAIGQHSANETLPGPEITTDDALLDYARRFGTTIYHPVGNMPHGGRRGSSGGSTAPSARDRRAAGDRRLNHADADHRQYERPHHHDRREGRRDDQGR